MKLSLCVLASFFLLAGCSHVAEKEVFKIHLTKAEFESSTEYLESLGLRDFDNSRDHSVYAYPLTRAYAASFQEFLNEHPRIKEFAETDGVIGRCFFLKIEARDLGRDEVDLVKWDVEFVQKNESRPMSFVRIPDVSPRRSVKRRITERGQETWWINETFVCSSSQLNLETGFALNVRRLDAPAEDSYKLTWLIL